MQLGWTATQKCPLNRFYFSFRRTKVVCNRNEQFSFVFPNLTNYTWLPTHTQLDFHQHLDKWHLARRETQLVETSWSQAQENQIPRLKPLQVEKSTTRSSYNKRPFTTRRISQISGYRKVFLLLKQKTASKQNYPVNWLALHSTPSCVHLLLFGDTAKPL